MILQGSVATTGKVLLDVPEKFLRMVYRPILSVTTLRPQFYRSYDIGLSETDTSGVHCSTQAFGGLPEKCRSPHITVNQHNVIRRSLHENRGSPQIIRIPVICGF